MSTSTYALSLKEAAKACGLSPDSLRAAIARGDLAAKKSSSGLAYKFLILPDALRDFLDHLEDA